MSPRPKRRSSTSDLKERIIAAAWEQIALEGAPALSLRAIARSLNIAAPSIYNYFPDRDALVTALIVEAFNSFAHAQEQSIAAIAKSEHTGRLRALGLAYRHWAVTYPERYHLIFGTPIAGYSAPAEITSPAAECSLLILVNVLAGAYSAGRLRVDKTSTMSPEIVSMLKEWQSNSSPDTPVEVFFLAVTIWSRVHGMVSLELSHQFPPFITDAGEIFHRELENILIDTIQ